jgi:hypothetical protein
MTKKSMKTGRVLLLTSLVAALAQAGAGRPQERDAGVRAEELEGMMEAYVLSKLQDSLRLGDEQFGRMVVAQKKLQDARRSYRSERGEILRQMRRALEREQAGEDELAPLLVRLDELQQGFLEQEKARYREIDAILDVRQRARYRILEAEIGRRLQQLIRDAREPAKPRDRSPLREP